MLALQHSLTLYDQAVWPLRRFLWYDVLLYFYFIFELANSQNIRVAATANDLLTKDNEILIKSLKEIALILKNHSLPKLTQWQALFIYIESECSKSLLDTALEREVLAQTAFWNPKIRRYIAHISEILNERIKVLFADDPDICL